jgi:hypothetical protein
VEPVELKSLSLPQLAKTKAKVLTISERASVVLIMECGIFHQIIFRVRQVVSRNRIYCRGKISTIVEQVQRPFEIDTSA